MQCECGDARIAAIGPITMWGTWCMCFNCGALSNQHLQYSEMLQQYSDGLNRYLTLTGMRASFWRGETSGLSFEV